MTEGRLNEIISMLSSDEQKMFLSACDYAQEKLDGRFRENSHPFFEHPCEVATIAHDMLGLDACSMTAIMLHEAGRFSCDSVSDINKSGLLEDYSHSYPKAVVDLVSNLNNIASIKLQETNLDPEKYRKLIVSYGNDPRAVLIKLCDRLEILRNIINLPPLKRKAKVMETMMLYIPLAHQLGLYHLKSEMEDIFLRFSEPDAYKEIKRQLKETEPQRNKLTREFVDPLKKKLDDAGIKYTFKARTKSPYSIWKKMKAKDLPFGGIFDVFAIRFIIDCPPVKEIEHELCWKVYSLVTEEYVPDIERLRDWISVPKKNGYESLHTTVSNKEGASIEIQIRTVRMDNVAEKGGAAHWAYKGINSKAALTEWLSKVRNNIKTSDGDKYESVPVVFEEVMVFTPSGELRQLRAGATVLDFAFEIHTNLGLKCTGGKINGKIVPIREKLKTGDVVDIISSKNQKPSADWLNFVVSSKARSKIRQKLNEEEIRKAAVGRELLDRRLKNWKLTLNDEDLNNITKKFKFKAINEFYGAIGTGELDPSEVKDFIYEKNTAHKLSDNVQHEVRSSAEEPLSTRLSFDSKLKGMEFKPAKCCCPKYGDDIFGFLTIREGIKIHRETCPNASRLKNNYPYRVLDIKWK